MKILFICGCLEPGKDGVGDYTRRLGAELIRQGVSVGILALNDYYTEDVNESNQNADGIHIPCVRLPNALKDTERCNYAKKWINLNNPEWLSLQFVPYSFNNKGLPFVIAGELKKIGGTRKWHIMFHELWLGMNQESSIKEKFIGLIQKRIIKQLISQINPKVINTQTQLYKKQIEKIGFEVTFLPLFSNVPVIYNAISTKQTVDIINKIPENYLIIFGSIHKEAPIDNFVKELTLYSKESYTLVTIGRNGNELNHWKSVCESYGLEMMNLGEQTLEIISTALKKASFGISTTPMALVEKSGSVAAMHEHGLPVICISKQWTPPSFIKKDIMDLEGVREYKEGCISDTIENIGKVNPEKNNIYTVSRIFLNNLK